MKENQTPNFVRPSITAELFTALFEVQKGAPSPPPQVASDGSEGVIQVTDDVEVVDLTTSLPLAERRAGEPRSMPTPCSPASDFCSRCLVSLSAFNFLAKLSHVKTCGGRVVDGQHAVARFLSYYGYDELQTAFEEKGIDMDFLFVADMKAIEQVSGIKTLGGRTKFWLALEQYKKSGRLHVRTSLVGDQIEENKRNQLHERNYRSSTWARSEAVISDGREHRVPAQRPREHTLDASKSASLDKVLLESLWNRPTDTSKRRINLTSCSTLWMAAGSCESNHVGIEERLRSRRRSKETVESIDSGIATCSPGRETVEQAHLARRDQHEDSKRMRLRATQDELEIAEQRVRRLRAEIAELQCEIDKEHDPSIRDCCTTV